MRAPAPDESLSPGVRVYRLSSGAVLTSERQALYLYPKIQRCLKPWGGAGPHQAFGELPQGAHILEWEMRSLNPWLTLPISLSAGELFPYLSQKPVGMGEYVCVQRPFILGCSAPSGVDKEKPSSYSSL